MEKICIVKRRKNNPHIVSEEGSSAFDSGLLPGSMAPVNVSSVYESNEARAESENVNTLVLSLKLTPDQSEAFRSNQIMKTLVQEIAGGVSLEIRQEQDDQYVIEVHPVPHRSLNMLTSDQVCQMLQISKSLVKKLVHERKISSYKIGRLRRFSLDDILAYLARNEDL